MQLADMNLIDLFRNWFFSLISKQNLLIVSFQGFVEMVLMKWKTILGPSCSFSSLVEITHSGNLAFLTMTWEACRRCLNKMKFKILKYWSFENSTLDSNKLSPALKKEKVFFSLMQFSISPKGLHQKFVLHWSSFCLLKWNQSEIAS